MLLDYSGPIQTQIFIETGGNELDALWEPIFDLHGHGNARQAQQVADFGESHVLDNTLDHLGSLQVGAHLERRLGMVTGTP